MLIAPNLYLYSTKSSQIKSTNYWAQEHKVAKALKKGTRVEDGKGT